MDQQQEKLFRRIRRRTIAKNTSGFTQSGTQKVPNWKTPGHDGIHGYRFKKFTSIHDRLATEMNRCYKKDIPKGNSTLTQKDPKTESPLATIEL